MCFVWTYFADFSAGYSAVSGEVSRIGLFTIFYFELKDFRKRKRKIKVKNRG